MAEALNVALITLTGLSAALYLLSATSIFRMYIIFREEPWQDLFLFFLLLALGQLSMMVSIVAPERISFALFTTSSAFVIAAYLSLLRSRHVALIVLLPAGLDLFASVLSAYLSATAKGYMRPSLALLAVAHIMRMAGALLAEAEILVLAEALRLLASAIFAVGYARKVI